MADAEAHRKVADFTQWLLTEKAMTGGERHREMLVKEHMAKRELTE